MKVIDIKSATTIDGLEYGNFPPFWRGKVAVIMWAERADFYDNIINQIYLGFNL